LYGFILKYKSDKNKIRSIIPKQLHPPCVEAGTRKNRGVEGEGKIISKSVFPNILK